MSNSVASLTPPLAPEASSVTPTRTSDASISIPTSANSVEAPVWNNPALVIDPALGLVVIEFRDDTGNVTSSLPTVRQLNAYRNSMGNTEQPSVKSAPAAGADDTAAVQTVAAASPAPTQAAAPTPPTQAAVATPVATSGTSKQA